MLCHPRTGPGSGETALLRARYVLLVRTYYIYAKARRLHYKLFRFDLSRFMNSAIGNYHISNRKE